MSIASKRSVTETLARKKVNQFLIIAIGERLSSGMARESRIGAKLYWQVPVMLGETEVGEILVDAGTGRLKIEEDTVSDIISAARRVSPKELNSSSEMYLARNAT